MKLPKVAMLRKLLYWAEERQRIYLKRKNGEHWPWTKDPILQKYKFCNTYREQDRVTQWIAEHWRDTPFLKNYPNLWFAMCIARQINWPDTLAAIDFPYTWEPRKVLKILDDRKKIGLKIFTSAYMIGGGPIKGYPKTRYIVMDVLNPLYRKFPYGTTFHSGTTLQSVFEVLIQFNGWGKFMAYEVVTDLRHTRYLCNAPDIHTWANCGPGAKRGLNRLYERDLDAPATQAQLLEELLEISEWIKRERDLNILPTWEPRDSEHSFCEFDKYSRVTERESQGKMIGLERYHSPGLIL